MRKLQPLLTPLLTHPRCRDIEHRAAELKRRLTRKPHTVTFYHRVDNPHSYLLAQVLSTLLDRYDIHLRCRTVSLAPIATAPRPDLLDWHALRDAHTIAPALGLRVPEAPSAWPSTEALNTAAHGLIALEREPRRYLQAAVSTFEQLLASDAPTHTPTFPKPLARHRRELELRGHYASGTLHYGGDWYMGVDRLPLLIDRLRALGLGDEDVLQPTAWRPEPIASDVDTLEIFLSIRSPYSYLAVQRTFDLGRRFGLRVVTRPVMPMVKRGLQVPLSKRLYLLRDAARMAHRLEIPFGRVCDPLPAVERVIAIMPVAREEGLEEAFLLSALGGAWSEGLDFTTDADLKKAVVRSGLDWRLASRALQETRWRDEVEANREALNDLGLWGVPSFRVGDFVTWGQDRIDAIEARLEVRQHALSA